MQQIKIGRLPSQMKSKAVDKLEGVTILNGRICLKERIYLKAPKVSVYIAYDNTLKKDVAVKVYQRDQLDEHDYKMYKYEVKVMQEVKSPHIIQFIEECDIPNTSKIYLVMEYCEGVTLHDYYNNDEYQKPELEALTYLVQILQGLYALHVRNFVHRDLKLENILVYRGKIKIIDYGFSKKVFEKNGTPLTKSQIGTEIYEAPEILLGQPYNPFKSDIYSLGVMLYLMQMKQYPYELKEAAFEDNPQQKLAFLIRDTKPLFPHQISKELKELIIRMLEFDPTKRLSLSELLLNPLLLNLLSLTNIRPEGALYLESQQVLKQYSQFYREAEVKTVFERYSDLVSTITLVKHQLTDEEEQQLSQAQLQQICTESKKRKNRDMILRNISAGYEFNFNVLIWLTKIFYNYQKSQRQFSNTQHQVMVLLFQLIVLEFKSYVESLKNNENTFLVDQEYWIELLQLEEYIKHKEHVMQDYYPILQSNEQFIIQDIKTDLTIEFETRQLLSTKKEQISQALTKRVIQLLDEFNLYGKRSQKNPSVMGLIANNILFYMTLIDTKTFFSELKRKGPFDFCKLEEQFQPKMQKIEEFLAQASQRSQTVLQKYRTIADLKEQTQMERFMDQQTEASNEESDA